MPSKDIIHPSTCRYCLMLSNIITDHVGQGHKSWSDDFVEVKDVDITEPKQLFIAIRRNVMDMPSFSRKHYSANKENGELSVQEKET